MSSRLCSAHFVSGKKVDDPDSPDFLPTVFRTGHVAPKTRSKLDRFQHQSINQSIYFQDRHVSLTIFFMNLVLSYDFHRICWTDVRRENRIDREEVRQKEEKPELTVILSYNIEKLMCTLVE